ncbi:hypothetical protein [Falsirhodobacter sp. 1013]|uniref:hypothetical protein n=1 Tax=Falsirhodobacter sp. 1013 TaxID=3417566 RepID=UPI003EB766A8
MIMGIHGRIALDQNLRLVAGPPARRRSRFYPSTVTVTIEPDFPGAGDSEFEATFDTATGNLVNVQMGGWTCPPHTFALIVGDAEFDRCCEAVADRINEAAAEATQDAEADWADHQNDLRRDH